MARLNQTKPPRQVTICLFYRCFSFGLYEETGEQKSYDSAGYGAVGYVKGPVKAYFSEIYEICDRAKEETVYAVTYGAANNEGYGELGQAVFALGQGIDENAAHNEGKSGQYPALHRAIALEQAPANTRVTDERDIHRAFNLVL